jgi:hypothetical protein
MEHREGPVDIWIQNAIEAVQEVANVCVREKKQAYSEGLYAGLVKALEVEKATQTCKQPTPTSSPVQIAPENITTFTWWQIMATFLFVLSPVVCAKIILPLYDSALDRVEEWGYQRRVLRMAAERKQGKKLQAQKRRPEQKPLRIRGRRVLVPRQDLSEASWVPNDGSSDNNMDEWEDLPRRMRQTMRKPARPTRCLTNEDSTAHDSGIGTPISEDFETTLDLNEVVVDGRRDVDKNLCTKME